MVQTRITNPRWWISAFLEKKNAIPQRWLDQSTGNLKRWQMLTLLTLPDVKIVVFKHARFWMAVIFSLASNTDAQKLFPPIQQHKMSFCYAYIYRNYMKHPSLIENSKCIQSCFIYFVMEFVLQIYRFKLLVQCNAICTILL